MLVEAEAEVTVIQLEAQAAAAVVAELARVLLEPQTQVLVEALVIRMPTQEPQAVQEL
jgi:hypothetical protein